MKILLHPGEILAAFFAGPAVATGRLAAYGSDKLPGLKRGGICIRGIPNQMNREDRGHRDSQESESRFTFLSLIESI